MRSLKYIAVIAIISFLAACSTEEPVAPPIPTDSDEVSFNITIPDMPEVWTRAAVEENTFDHLYVLVFNHYGEFIGRYGAYRTSTSDPGAYKVLLPKTDDLPSNERKRTLHFIANADWSGFSEIKSIGKWETEILRSLTTTDGKIAYWKKIEMPNGITQSALNNPVELICNIAKVSVLNNAGTGPQGGTVKITDVSFALGDWVDHGTVVPYNSNFIIGEEYAAESTEGSRHKVYESNLGIYYAGSGTNSGGIINCYEHTNSTSATPMYVMVRCKYTTTGPYYYYKLAIKNHDTEIFPDIRRNIHYKINIQKVVSPGYSTLQDAIDGAASNNVIYSVLLEKYTAISYGTAALYVETVNKNFVTTNTAFTIGYNYYPNKAGSVNNSSVSVDLEQDNAKPVVTWNRNQNQGTGVIRGTTASSLPAVGQEYTARFIIKSTQSGIELRRVINLRLRRPALFTTSGNPYFYPSTIPSSAGQVVELHFNIPSDLPDSYYPFNVYMTVTNLSPYVKQANRNSNLVLDHSEPGKYRYMYEVTGPGAKTVYFETIHAKSPSGTTLLLEGEMFQSYSVRLG